MSEPLTSHEIEDVLSSIRRLVSEDLRPASRLATPPAAPPAVREAEKLMLTPSLRVVAPVVDAPPAFVEPEPLSAPEPGPSAAASRWPPVQDYDDFGLDDDLPVAAAPTEPAKDYRADPVPEAGWIEVEDDWPEDIDAHMAVPFVAHARRASLADDPLARAWADRAEAEVRAELSARVTPPPAAPPPAAPPVAEAPMTDPVSEALDDGPGLFDGDTAGIDEEALRDIVREILREELSGALGERITRNVRKLVRVEINRALTAREFE